MNRILAVSVCVLLVVAGACLAMTWFGQGRGYSCHGCNVLLFTIDTVRSDHLSSYGYFMETTPNMDLLAGRGVLFEEAYVQIPFTPPSHWSIMTGLYPFHHGVYLPTGTSDLDTLAARLSGHGYSTAGFTSSYMVGELGNGFDVFEVPGYGGDDIYRPAGEVSDSAISWLAGNGDAPFFLWVHYFDAHSPYEPPDSYDTYDYSAEPAYSGAGYSRTGVDNFNTIRHDLAKYDGEISYVDSEVGRVLSFLDGLGLRDNTLVVLVSDHGECFGEHNFSDFGYDFSGPCLFHDKTLYQEEVHVPFMIVNPNSTRTGVRIADMVESVDVMPTILDVLGLQPGEGLDGKSLVPLIRGNAAGFDRAFFQVSPGQSGSFAYGLMTPDWKFVSTGLSRDANGSINTSTLLFNRISDPHEKSDVHLQNPGMASELEDELFSVMAGASHQSIYIDSRTEEILRIFGYVE